MNKEESRLECLAIDLLNLRKEKAEIEKREKDIKDILTAYIIKSGDNSFVGKLTISMLSSVSRRSVDTEILKTEFPQAYESCLKEVSYKTLTVKER